MFRFTIRELVLLTLVVALGFGFCLQRLEMIKRSHQAYEATRALWELGYEIRDNRLVRHQSASPDDN